MPSSIETPSSRTSAHNDLSDRDRPESFAELLTLTPSQLRNVDIARMNLLCAERLPGAVAINVDECLACLDRWALRIRQLTDHNLSRFHAEPARYDNSEPLWRLLCIASVLKSEFRVHYPAELKSAITDSRDASNLFLHGLLGPSRHGTCSSLPVLMVGIGRRLGYPMSLCHAPGHVFCRWDGLSSQAPAWRERHNVDFNGDELNIHNDDYYRHWPFEWSDATYEMERRRGRHHLYLRSLTPTEELASFLDQRANCLEDHAIADHHLLDEAWACYAKATELSNYNWVYRSFAMTVHRKKLVLALLQWGWSPEQFVQAVQDRFAGSPSLYPWEVDIGQPAANSIAAESWFRKPPAGFHLHESTAILEPLGAVEQVFSIRMGTSHIAPSRFPIGAFGSQRRRYPDYSLPIDPVRELCVFTGERTPNVGRFVGLVK